MSAHFGTDFDIDRHIEEVNALLNSTQVMDCFRWQPKLELKQLPDTLKYVFIGPSKTLLVIIALDFDSFREEKHDKILGEHKEAKGWSVADIKGISPSIVQHRIYLEENVELLMNHRGD